MPPCRTIQALENELADEIGRKDIGDQTDDERHGKALDRPGSKREQESRGDQRRCMRVDDDDPHALESIGNGGLDRLAVTQLLADALKDEHVGVHADADGQNHAGNSRQC
jgi:hypothetical protein